MDVLPLLYLSGTTRRVLRVSAGTGLASAVRSWQAALFMASAMAITAFPMLARILYESEMAQTRIGTLAIGAAAFDDATAWCLLAAVIASLQGQPAIAGLAVGGGVAYAFFMATIGRWLFRRFEAVTRGERHAPHEPAGDSSPCRVPHQAGQMLPGQRLGDA